MARFIFKLNNKKKNDNKKPDLLKNLKISRDLKKNS